ncbi:nuclear protein localization protein 4 [Gonapodya sp. JEL0774]|nr:nuclear protein localization protein 4 [Gonapodya sp. JEL0774]
MVDHVEFESASIVENFLRYWRTTGVQRFGYLYGRYEPYDKVALGVKAVVVAVYEPPQDGAVDGIQMHLPDPDEARADQVAATLGLRKVGTIYTDLLDDGTGRGTVVCKRHAGSYFLSSAESVFAAHEQLRHPTPTRYSTSGTFGSRMVTCVVSGDQDGGITVFAYQVSNTAQAMVRDGIVEPATDPSVVLVKESTERQYVPEVFYKYKNGYNILVQEAAKPAFPVEYLLVTLTHGFPQNPSPTFVSTNPFPIEHREDVEPQDLAAVKRTVVGGAKLGQALSDFHLLLYIKGMGVVSETDFALACKAALSHSDVDASELTLSPSWQTFITILNTTSSTVYKALIAAKYNGLEVEEDKGFQIGVTNTTPAFLNKFPLGKVPAFEGADGFTLYESNAIAYYVASSKKDTKLLGKDKQEAAKIQQYIFLADNEISPAAATWTFPILGWIPFNKVNQAKAIEDIKKTLSVLDKILLRRTFLVGETVTLADITVFAALLNLYKLVLEPEIRKPYVNVNRWFLTLAHQAEFSAVVGEVNLCEKAAEPKKAEDKPKEEKKKEEKKPKEEKKKEEKKPKEEKKKEEQPPANDDDEDEKPVEKKAPNALDLLPPSKFNLENWKRFYSNNDTRPTAVNYFWDNFDKEGFSIWKVDYKYNEELTMTFMSSNLVGGFFQRLESARKYAFGVLLVLGENNNSVISGYFVFRGQEVPEMVVDAPDYESFEFTKVDSDNAAVRKDFEDYLAWDVPIGGRKFADGKAFK